MGEQTELKPPVSRGFVSLVVPLWNEVEIIDLVVDSLKRIFQDCPRLGEIIFVDDGSSDGTAEKLSLQLTVFPSARLVRLSRNFGQQAAYRAGLDQARGDAVIFLDADLQDPPELISQFIREWERGAKLVVGVRTGRQERGVRRLCFDLFHIVFSRMTGNVMPENSGTFGLMDRVIVDALKSMPEINLFLPALRGWCGYPTAQVNYERKGRIGGKAKQSYWKLLNYAWDGITSFSHAPLRLITLTGLVISAAGFLYGSFLVIQRVAQFFGFFRNLEVLGFTTLAAAIFFMGGVQMICLGVLGEYIARIYLEVKRRPHYLIRDIIEPSR